MNKKHALLMVVCCLIPVAALILISFFNIPVKSVFFYAMLFFCPLSHILMMKSMGHSHMQENSPSADHTHHDTFILKE